jgi:hypothetical protein
MWINCIYLFTVLSEENQGNDFIRYISIYIHFSNYLYLQTKKHLITEYFATRSLFKFLSKQIRYATSSDCKQIRYATVSDCKQIHYVTGSDCKQICYVTGSDCKQIRYVTSSDCKFWL